jgi:hypothetical protein
MNRDFLEIISATPQERRDLFLGAAGRLGTTEQNVEKDFWVCWTLDALFNGLPGDGPRLLFKGGTSLSKAFGLIPRFSEDIDITVFREDLGHPASIEELEALSGKKRKKRLDEIKTACQRYISGTLLASLGKVLEETGREAGLAAGALRLELDSEDPDRQSLLIGYPTTTPDAGTYIRPAVKIESGAKSALEPNRQTEVRPYIADDLNRLRLEVRGITTVVPERTFWDKVIIIHGQRRWFERRGELQHQGQRVSRHYYDVYRMLQIEVGRRAIEERELALDCARHARMFFGRPDLDLKAAVPGRFALCPVPGMMEALQRDYTRMAGMIIGAAPAFEDVIARIGELEIEVNAAADAAGT